MTSKKKLLTLSQWKKKNKIRVRRLTVRKELFKGGIYEKLDDFITRLHKLKAENPEYDIYVETEGEPAYYESYEGILIIVGQREETDKELEDRIQSYYNGYLDQEKRKRQEYEKLKKEYGD